MSECEHKDFEASVTVNRMEDVKRFAADVHIVCRECKRPFCFVGLSGGLHPEFPTVSVDQAEARLPIVPMDEYFWQLLRDDPLERLRRVGVAFTDEQKQQIQTHFEDNS